VKAVVLVGGEGTRLRPLTYTTPKQLLPVGEVPMLERVVAALAVHGVDEAVLSIGYRPDAFFAAYPDGTVAGVRLSYAVEPEPLDTAGAIRFAAEQAEVQETFLVVNGDVLTDLDVSALLSLHRRQRASATIALTAVEDPSRFGVVVTNGEGRVEAFVEKPEPGRAPSDEINAGTYVFEPEVVARIPGGRRVSVEREIFPTLAAEGTLYAWCSDAYWLDTGTPEAYLRANADLLTGARPGPPAPGAREVDEGVWTVGEATIEGTVRAPSLLGAGAVVEAGAEVDASVVGAGGRVGAGARVGQSVLLPGAVIGRDASVRGSIIGHRARVGAGAVLDALSVVGDGTEIEAGSRLVGARVPAVA
jgi:mannose-1-phosphate guanylyltransferase